MQLPRYQLDTDRVLATVRKLRDRIGDRFPGSGLFGQSKELVHIGERSKARIAWISRPIWPLRVATFLVVGLLVLLIVLVILNFRPDFNNWKFEEFVSLYEAGANDLILTSLGIFFLLTIEVRIKRKRALNSLHELRSMAHVIDMHQLTKDPDRILSSRTDTSHSPKSTMTAFQLRRYLDYCSEMLSLCSKIASSYIQNFEDSAAVAAVNEIEDLTNGLSRKIWQKIMILQSMSDAGTRTESPRIEQQAP